MTDIESGPGSDPGQFGADLRRRDFVSAVLRHTAYARGFEPLAVPILERATSFAEVVVGRSPWPEWNPLGVFAVPVADYTADYADTTAIDLGVVRSHEYYTGVSFEVDVIHDDTVYVEIAGGGRYDKLIGHFTGTDLVAVPATGFAFGMERLTVLLAAAGAFDTPAVRTEHYRFDAPSADQLVVPDGDPGTVAGYLRARNAADRRRHRVDVWVGDTAEPGEVAAYARARGIGDVVWC